MIDCNASLTWPDVTLLSILLLAAVAFVGFALEGITINIGKR